MTRFGRSGYKINFQVAGLLWDYRYRKMTTGTGWDYTIDYTGCPKKHGNSVIVFAMN